MNRLKTKIWRDKDYGRWISSNVPCCITGSTEFVTNHHIKGEGYGSVKAPDFMQMALSHHLHQELHTCGWKAFEAKYEVSQRVMVAVTLHDALEHGRIDWDEIKDQVPDWLIYNLEFCNDF